MHKTLSKVTGIVTTVFGGIYILSGLLFLLFAVGFSIAMYFAGGGTITSGGVERPMTDHEFLISVIVMGVVYGVMALVLIVFAIANLIVGIFTLKKLNTPSLKGWLIASIIVGAISNTVILVLGILALVLKDPQPTVTVIDKPNS